MQLQKGHFLPLGNLELERARPGDKGGPCALSGMAAEELARGLCGIQAAGQNKIWGLKLEHSVLNLGLTELDLVLLLMWRSRCVVLFSVSCLVSY